MNTNLQISLARDHQQQMLHAAAEARLAATDRGSRPGVFKSWVGTVRVHVPGVGAKSVRVAAS